MEAFERLGSIIGSDEADEPFVCLGCDAAHEVAYHVCPACGGFSVERRTEE